MSCVSTDLIPELVCKNKSNSRLTLIDQGKLGLVKRVPLTAHRYRNTRVGAYDSWCLTLRRKSTQGKEMLNKLSSWHKIRGRITVQRKQNW